MDYINDSEAYPTHFYCHAHCPVDLSILSISSVSYSALQLARSRSDRTQLSGTQMAEAIVSASANLAVLQESHQPSTTSTTSVKK